ncbi:MAG: universal stress protein [Candidatus Thermoplasmatota archaeon]|jgi:nucleotide-binding universal stress UspA family protein|nr:universal stress protein [Candidatus Thermoplasmatota archaeon]
MKDVMVAIDSPECLERAVKEVVYLFPEAERFDLVYLMPVNYSHFWAPDQQKRESSKRKIEEKIRQVLSLNVSTATKFRVEIIEDDPDRELTELSRRENVDAIVIERWSRWKGRHSITKRIAIKTISNSGIPVTILN